MVDLCAAPGSWSQVIAKRLQEKGLDLKEEHLCSVDLIEIAEIEGSIGI